VEFLVSLLLKPAVVTKVSLPLSLSLSLSANSTYLRYYMQKMGLAGAFKNVDINTYANYTAS
jgi:hypothetical protein